MVDAGPPPAAALATGSKEVSCTMERAMPGSSRILPADRRVEWVVGIPGGIPIDRPAWKSVTDAPYHADPTGRADSTPAFNRAIADTPEGHVLFVPEGTYRLDHGIRWQGRLSHRTLRGAGPDRTKLLFYGGMLEMGPGSTEGRTGLDVNARRDSLAVDVDLSQDAVKGETHVHLAALPSWVKPGYLYIIDQLDDPSFVASGGQEGSAHPREVTVNGPRGLGQIVKVTSIGQNGPSDYQVDFEIPLYYGFRIEQQAQLAGAGYDLDSEVPLSECGIEDLYIEGKHAQGWSRGVPGHLIRMDSCLCCWVKNIESHNVPANCHVSASFCYRLEIRDSSFHDSHAYGGGEAYGVILNNITCASLVENNIFRHLHCTMSASYGASGNVFGYNYVFEGTGSAATFTTVSHHATHAYMNLWEGNHGEKALADWTHGSSSHNTLLRNRLRGYDPGGTWDQSAVHISYYNRKCNLLGNTLGTPGYHTIYQRCNGEADRPWLDRAIYRLGYSSDNRQDPPPYDGLATLDLLRHGDYDTVTDSIQWDPSIADHDLPPSLYLKEKPAWFGDLPWPAFGPGTAGLDGKIPTEVRVWGPAGHPKPVPPPPPAE